MDHKIEVTKKSAWGPILIVLLILLILLAGGAYLVLRLGLTLQLTQAEAMVNSLTVKTTRVKEGTLDLKLENITGTVRSGQSVDLKPPRAQQRSNERSDKTTNIDEDIENLETRVALSLGNAQCLFTLLGSLRLEVVVHLSYDGLQVALEQTVTEGNEEQCHTRQWQQPRDVSRRSQDGHREDDIS